MKKSKYFKYTLLVLSRLKKIVMPLLLLTVLSGEVMAGLKTELLHHQFTREFSYYVPSSAPSNAALVIDLHPFITPKHIYIQLTKAMELADEKGFVVAFPQGYLSWNAGSCCVDILGLNILAPGRDDVGYIRKVVNQVKRRVSIDDRRVYVIGYSNGAAMAHRLAMEASDVFAAVGAHAFHLDTNESAENDLSHNQALNKPDRPISVIEIHGNADTNVDYPRGGNFGTVLNGFKKWAEYNGCLGLSKVTSGEWDHGDGEAGVDLFHAIYESCDEGVQVSQIVNGDEHVTDDFSVGHRQMWDFVSQFKLPYKVKDRPRYCKYYDAKPLPFVFLRSSCTG